MDLQEIEERINRLLSSDYRKIVFWYDEDAEYIDDIDRLMLAEGYKIWKVTKNNWFETKLTFTAKKTKSVLTWSVQYAIVDGRCNSLFFYAQNF